MWVSLRENHRSLIGFGLATLLLAVYPFFIGRIGGGDFWITLVFQVFVWVTLSVSWNFFSGYSGYASFGHGAFYGVGMYATATLLVRAGLPFLATLPLAGAVAAGLAWLTGVVVFRLPQFRGELFSLLTLAMTFIVATIVNNVDWLDGGGGVFLREAEGIGRWGDSNIGLYYLSLVIAMSCVGTAYVIYNSRWGQALFAIRDDEDVADGLGVPTIGYKIGTFAASAFFAGVIGGVQSLFIGYLETATVFAVAIPLLALMMAIFGGAGIWYGPVIGAVVITLLRQSLTSGETAVLNQIIIGMVLVLTILFIPQGIGGIIEERMRRS